MNYSADQMRRDLVEYQKRQVAGLVGHDPAHCDCADCDRALLLAADQREKA